MKTTDINGSCVNRLLLFLRYPQPGRTKTRLIPALGAQGAAHLQRQMMEHLLKNLCPSLADPPTHWQLEIHFTGCSLENMQTWLGQQLTYVPQSTGDLGMRLQAGFQQGFSNSDAQARIVAIGSDCPDLSTTHIQAAFHQLVHHDVVLGPARDGGYYLIGLRQPQSILFQEIDWSTSVVFQQTKTKAQLLGLSVAELAMLSDIDRPEDLAIWQRIQQNRLQGVQWQHIPLKTC